MPLPPKRLAWDGTQQPARHQPLLPPAQPTGKAGQGHTHLTIQCLQSNTYHQKTAVLEAQDIGLFRDSPPDQYSPGTVLVV